MHNSERTRLAVLFVAIALLTPAGALVWLRLTSPTDGAWLMPGQPVWRVPGVVVTPLHDQPRGLRQGDVVVAVAGRSLTSWARVPSVASLAWRVGQQVPYTVVVRSGRRLNLTLTLAPGYRDIGPALAASWGVLLFGLAFLLLAAFAWGRRPDDRAARVLLVWATSVMGSATWALGLTVSDLLDGRTLWLYLVTTVGVHLLLWSAGLHFALLFPQPLPLVGRRPWLVPLLYSVPYALLVVPALTRPLGPPAVLIWSGALDTVQSGTILAYVTLTVLALVANDHRARHDAVTRRQVRWVVWALVVSGMLAIVCWLVPELVLGRAFLDGNVLALCALPLPVALAVAIVRTHLFDIDVVLHRTLVYGLLTACVVGVYVLVVGVFGTLVQARGSPLVALLATGLIAVLVQPLRARLQRAITHLLYGERDEPYAVLARLGGRLEATLAPEAVLPTIVETVAQALKLPYAAITLPQGAGADTVVAAYGRSRGEVLHLPLVYHTTQVGQLLLAPRTPGEPFSTADRRLLEDLAGQVGVAAHAVQLTVDLQRSRERLVTAREEERRRLRRDLHDGLGPTLAGFTLTVGAIRNVLAQDPARADALLAELGTAIEAAVGDIRRLVYDLRPPALDELGLVGALRARTAAYGRQPGIGANRLTVCVEAPKVLPPLPAAVEVAAYRIVEEALANVIRHARAQHCVIRLAVTAVLELEIVDDGIGLPAERPLGVGLVAMRERATELGGTCLVEPLVAGGTRVWARLPVNRA